LQRAVACKADLFGLLLELRDRRVFVWCPSVLRIDRHRRDEGVVADVTERVDRLEHNPRNVAGRVDHGVEAAAGERAEGGVTVAWQLLEFREELGSRPASVEQHHVMAAYEGGFDQVTAEELGAAEHEDLHTPSLCSQHAMS